MVVDFMLISITFGPKSVVERDSLLIAVFQVGLDGGGLAGEARGERAHLDCRLHAGTHEMARGVNRAK